MGNNFIFGHDFLAYTPVMSSADTNYPVANLLLYNNLFRHSRSTVKTEVTISIDMGAATVLAGVMLNDVNFTAAYVEGSADNVTWDFSQLIAISEDKTVKRYKIYVPLTAFNYRYFRVRITAQDPVARFPDTALSVFRIGTLVLCKQAVELTYNPAAGPYTVSGAYPEPLINKFMDGGDEVVSRGDTKRGNIKFSFSPTTLDQVGELRDLDAILKPTSNVVFYRNNGDTWECYLCRSRGAFETQESDVTFSTSTYELAENK